MTDPIPAIIDAARKVSRIHWEGTDRTKLSMLVCHTELRALLREYDAALAKRDTARIERAT